MSTIDEDDYAPPPRMARGTKVALAGLGAGIMALGLLGLVAVRISRTSAEQSNTYRTVTERLPTVREGQKIDDATLANHPFWRRPLSVEQVRAILGRLEDEGRTLPLIIDDGGRMVDDDRAVAFSQKYWSATIEGRIGKRWICLPEDKLSDQKWRDMLLRGMNEIVASERYEEKHR